MREIDPNDRVVQTVCGHEPLMFRYGPEGEKIIRPCSVCGTASPPLCPDCGEPHWREIDE